MKFPSDASDAGERVSPRTTCIFLGLAITLPILVTAGCTAPAPSRESRPAPAPPAEYRATDIRVRLIGALRAGDKGTLIEDPGWVEYVLAIDNIGGRPLTIYNVKLLNADGRYLDSAASYEQVTAPPDAASEVAGTVAKSSAGAAAGQVVPFGGAIVSIFSSALSASAAESRRSAKRELELRKLKLVELAPGGHLTGSAFLPRVTNAKALVLDYGRGNGKDRIAIPLAGYDPHVRGGDAALAAVSKQTAPAFAGT